MDTLYAMSIVGEKGWKGWSIWMKTESNPINDQGLCDQIVTGGTVQERV